jgi:hypothetical protein
MRTHFPLLEVCVRSIQKLRQQNQAHHSYAGTMTAIYRMISAQFTPYRALVLFIFFGTGCSGSTPYDDFAIGTPVGDGRYSRSTFFVSPEMNLVYDLQRQNASTHSTAGILAVTSDGCRLLSPEGNELRFRMWRGGSPDGAAIVIGREGTNFAISQHGKLSFYDWEGTPAWRVRFDGIGNPLALYGNDGAVRGIAAGYRAEYFGIHGERLMELRRGSGSSFCMVEVRPSQRQESQIALKVHDGIISSSWKVQIVDNKGRIVSEWTSASLSAYYDFTALRRPDGLADELLFICEDHFEVRRLDGTLDRTYVAPLSHRFGSPIAYRLGKDDTDGSMLVLASSKGAAHVHGIYVYDSAGKLQYCEFGQDDANALLVLPNKSATQTLPTFLLGARGRISKFVPTGAGRN